VRPEVLAARQRGVFFDIGHGMGSFSFKVARLMLANGFFPDTISSDIHALCINGPAFDQVTTLSKFLNLGMPFTEVVRASTQNAALAKQKSPQKQAETTLGTVSSTTGKAGRIASPLSRRCLFIGRVARRSWRIRRVNQKRGAISTAA